MDKNTETTITNAAIYLVLIAALNAGLTLLDFNLLTMINLGDFFTNLVLGLFGASALWLGYLKFVVKKKLSF